MSDSTYLELWHAKRLPVRDFVVQFLENKEKQLLIPPSFLPEPSELLCILSIVSDDLYWFQELEVNGQAMTSSEWKMLASGLKKNSYLLTLSLVSWGLGKSEAALQVLLDGISRNASVETLNLSGNLLTDTLLEPLGDILKMNVCLKSLIMDGNKLKDAGFLTGLTNNETLESLSLAQNPIDSTGFDQVLLVTATCLNLTSLNLQRVKMPDIVIESMDSWLKELTINSLTIDLPADASTIEDIEVVMMKHNRSLSSLISRHINWDQSSGTLLGIHKALRANAWLAGDQATDPPSDIVDVIQLKRGFQSSTKLVLQPLEFDQVPPQNLQTPHFAEEEEFLKEAYGSLDKETDRSIHSTSVFNDSPRLSYSDSTNENLELFDPDIKTVVIGLKEGLSSLERAVAEGFSNVESRVSSFETAIFELGHRMRAVEETTHTLQTQQENTQTINSHPDHNTEISNISNQQLETIKALEDLGKEFLQYKADQKDSDLKLEGFNTKLLKLPSVLQEMTSDTSANVENLTRKVSKTSEKLVALQGSITKTQKSVKQSQHDTLQAVTMEKQEDRQLFGKRLEAIEREMVEKAELVKIKRYLRLLQREFLDKVSRIEEVFSEDNKANYFSTIFHRLSNVESQLIAHDSAVNSEREPFEHLQNRLNKLEKDQYELTSLRNDMTETMGRMKMMESQQDIDVESQIVETPPAKRNLPWTTRADINISVGKQTQDPRHQTLPSIDLDDSSVPLRAEHLSTLEATENDLSNFIPGEKEIVVRDAILTRTTGLRNTDSILNYSASAFKNLSPLHRSIFRPPAATAPTTERHSLSGPSSELQSKLRNKGFVITDNKPLMRRGHR